MKILVVDDDRHICDLILCILAEQGYRDILVADSVDAALSLIAQQLVPFGCFLLDIHMPARNGIELCSLIRDMPCYARSPIIMLTAARDEASIDCAFAAGASDFATKPFEITQLCSRIRLAELIIEGQRRGKAWLIPTTPADQMRATTSDQELADAFESSGYGYVIPAFSFENYLKQLSRSGMNALNVYVVKFRRSRLLDEIYPGEAFLPVLTQVADAISDVFGKNRVLMTYSGDATLMCYGMDGDTENLEERIEAAIGNDRIGILSSGQRIFNIQVDVIALPFLLGPYRTGMTVAEVMARAQQILGTKALRSTGTHLRLVAE